MMDVDNGLLGICENIYFKRKKYEKDQLLPRENRKGP